MKSVIAALWVLALSSLAPASLTATFAQGDQTVTQPVHFPALFVAENETPAPGLAPGPFTVVYEGTLNLPKRYRLVFSHESQGALTLEVNEKEVAFEEGKSASTRLNPGPVPFKLTFQSPESGPASFRLFWEEQREFPREPVPSSVFTHAPPSINPAHLIASHNCLKCHTSDLGPHAMPELANTGPDLTHIGDRSHEAWLTRWIAQPDQLKPTTTMPAMVDHTKPEGAQAAADLGAYLATLKSEKPAGSKPDLTLAQEGGTHFHKLGCIACHTKPDASEPDFENQRVPLNNLAAKYHDGALADFLKNPQAHHPSIKMPQFNFSEEEIDTLTAYLIQTSTGNHTPDPSEFPPGDPTRGKSLAAQLNCAACHTGLEPSSSAPAPKLTDLLTLDDWHQKGCLGPDEKRGSSPRLILSPEEKKSLSKKVLPQLEFDTVEAFTDRQIESLNCTACHDYQGQSSLLSRTHQESNSLIAHLNETDERLAQTRPVLTHLGAMLHTDYLQKIFEGTPQPRPRPWLEVRMPAFPHYAHGLAHGLGQHHGLPASTPTKDLPNPDQIKMGQELVSMNGYACVTCHGVNEAPALVVFEVQGINFGLAHQRLRKDFYHQWMFNPLRIVPDSKMPRYTNPEDGSALRGDFLGGDAQQQFEAVWQYLQSVSGQ